MSSETHITKENVGVYLRLGGTTKLICQEHLNSLKREMEFLEEAIFRVGGSSMIRDRIIDIKSAIKFYKEAGIK